MSEVGEIGPVAGWFPDPWYTSGFRWWTGTEWSEHTTLKPRKRDDCRWLRFPLGIGAAVFLAVGIGLVILGIVIHPARFTVFPITATVQSPLKVEQCRVGQPVNVAVPWKGSPVSVKYYDNSCKGPFSAGDELHLFAGSDSPADLGPTQRWILEPDTHSPFAIVGPTYVRSTIITFGLMALVPGVTLLIGYLYLRRRRL